MNYVLFIEYDGTNYAGWQVQKKQITIQGEIERNLYIIFKESIKIIGAGRTDTGVHARGQVANFKHSSVIDFDKIQRSLNGLLKKDIRIKKVFQVNNDFHARYSAILREYHYNIVLNPTALHRNFCWYIPYKLDLDKMRKAAEGVIGQHNFKSFCRIISDISNYDCRVKETYWKQNGELLTFVIQADRFLHGMVRALVGTLIDIGRNKLQVSDITRILSKSDRTFAAQSAPAKGLILERVYYNKKYNFHGLL